MMKKTGSLIIVFFFFTLLLPSLTVADEAKPQKLPFQRLVLAHYYPWYGNPAGPSEAWVHWNPETARHDSTNTPLLGWYDSKDSKIIARHIRWAKIAGIDGFIVSWWGYGFTDEALEILLRVAERENFKITINYEDCLDRAQLQEDFKYLIRKYAPSKAWLKVNQRPIFFVYSRVLNKLTPQDFESAFEGLEAFIVADTMNTKQAEPFEGVYTYLPVRNIKGYAAALPQLRKDFQSAGKLFCATVFPGYDDTVIRHPGLREDRQAGVLYEDVWAAAAPNADWMIITSWNEWHEGSEIEPSKEYGFKYIEMTKKLSTIWRNQQK